MKIDNVSFHSTPQNLLVINYDLVNAPKRNRYDVKLYVIAKDSSIILPKSFELNSSIGPGVRGGRGKEIVWDILKDEPELIGDFCVQLKAIPSISRPGPANAFYSVLVPGWGDYKVRNGKGYYWITISSLSSLAFASVASFISKRNYQNYLGATEYLDLEHYYSRANNWNKISLISFGVGSIIWATDIIGVLIKGRKNNVNSELRRNRFAFGIFGDQSLANVRYVIKF